MTNTVIFIVGPTAVGKTEYAIAIAKALDGEIVSADSMQIYKHMDIGSAKPSAEERAEARHWLVDAIEPTEVFSAARYQQMAKSCIREILKSGKTPVIAGGTGLYVNALIYDMDFSARPLPTAYRQELERLAESQGTDCLHQLLAERDPQTAARIHPNNVKKIIRALEILHASGESAREFERSFVRTRDYHCILIGLTRDRSELYERINKRTDKLFEQGLVEEVRRLRNAGLARRNIAMQGIGYKEIFDYLDGTCTLEETIETVKKNSRNYAKRQWTWFRRYDDIKWFDLSGRDDKDAVVREVLEWIGKKYATITNQTSQTI